MALELAALHSALGLLTRPDLVNRARGSKLPSGTTLLMELAAGDNDLISQCADATNHSASAVREAAEFFVEQVLIHETSDSYRTLGTDASADSEVLRQNMALLMRWLHPDTKARANADSTSLDRTVLAERVSVAWNNLKSRDRREAYDASLKRVAAMSGPIGTTAQHMRHDMAVSRRRNTARRLRNSAMNGESREGGQRGSAMPRAPRKRVRVLKVVPRLNHNWVFRILLDLFGKK